MLVLFLIILYICFISVWAPPSGWRSCHTNFWAPPSGWRISHTDFWARQVVGGVAIRIFGPAKRLADQPYGFLGSPSGWRISHTDFWARQVVGGAATRIFLVRQVVGRVAIRIFQARQAVGRLAIRLRSPGRTFSRTRHPSRASATSWPRRNRWYSRSGTWPRARPLRQPGSPGSVSPRKASR